MIKTNRGVQRTVIILLCIMVVFVGAVVSRILRSSESAETQQVVVNVEALQQQGAFIRPEPKALKNFLLTGTDGQPFTREDFTGQWGLVFLGYTHCPDICPTTLSLFKQLNADWQQTELANIQYVLLTADPERDTPERLQQYLQFFNEGFVGVTGEVAGVADLAKQLNGLFARVPQENGDYLVDHSANIVIINPEGQYYGFIRPPHSVQQIKSIMEAVTAVN